MYSTCLIISFLMNAVSNSNGIQDAEGINLDFNRIQPIPDQKSWSVERQKTLQRTHENFNNAIDQIFRNYDSRRNFYPPKQDPKLFYQSEMYKKIVNNDEITNDISAIVLDRNVQSTHGAEPSVLNSKYSSSVCVKCPHDMTLIAKPGSDRVLLQMPRIKACSGYRAPRHFHFKQMYGPHIGSLIEKGSHMIVGRVMKNNVTHQLCKLQVHVITQGCPMPKYLIAHCDKDKGSCDFTCRNQKLILYGPRTLTCGPNLQWDIKLPVCKAPSGCQPPSVPNHGHIRCKGVTKPNGPKFLEGARCRVICQKGWIPNSKPTSVCRRGSWTRVLNCIKKVL